MTSTLVDHGPWTDAAFPRPSDAEWTRRWDSVRHLAREAGARAVVVAGHGGGTAEIQHLANVAVRWESLLVASVDADVPPRLLLQLDNHAAGAADWTTVSIEVTGSELAGAAASWLFAHLGPSDPIGLLGPISERTGQALREALPGRPVIALGPAFQRHRLIKSDEELAWVAWAASACDEAITGFRADARPGMTEQELAALLVSHVVSAGAQPGICFLATAPALGGEAVVPRHVPARRRTGSGDLVLFELSAGMCGVTTQILRTIVLDGVAEPRVRQLHDVADAAFGGLLAAVRPGVTPAHLEAAGSAIIEGAGMTIVDDLVHGYGGGYLPPVLRTTNTRRSSPPELPLEAGMLLVLQPNVVSGDGRMGVQTGELIAVTADGVRTFHQTTRGLLAAPMH
jgi:Xaa-Pro aminopeptidase